MNGVQLDSPPGLNVYHNNTLVALVDPMYGNLPRLEFGIQEVCDSHGPVAGRVAMEWVKLVWV